MHALPAPGVAAQVPPVIEKSVPLVPLKLSLRVDQGVGIHRLLRLRARDGGQSEAAKKRHQKRERDSVWRNLTGRNILLQNV